jgi:DNA-directed RNA polymerase alpha subunit
MVSDEVAVLKFLRDVHILRELDYATRDLSEDAVTLQKDLLQGRVKELYNQYAPLLKDSVEGRYLVLLKAEYGVTLASEELDEVYNTKIADCNFKSATKTRLKQNGILYIGELVQKEGVQLLEFNYFGTELLRDTTEVLREDFSMGLGQKIDYRRLEEE